MFYDRFKQLCDERGVSCNKAALDIGLSNATPTQWKKRGLTPKADTLQLIADYFGVTIDHLLNSLPGLHTTSYANGVVVFRAPTEEDIEKKLSELEPDTFDVVYRGNCIAITVDRDGGATKEQIDQVIESYTPKEQKEKPTPKGELEAAISQRLHDLTSEELEDVNAYIDFLLSKRK